MQMSKPGISSAIEGKSGTNVERFAGLGYAADIHRARLMQAHANGDLACIELLFGVIGMDFQDDASPGEMGIIPL